MTSQVCKLRCRSIESSKNHYGLLTQPCSPTLVHFPMDPVCSRPSDLLVDMYIRLAPISTGFRC